jgi:hypothetical protein
LWNRGEILASFATGRSSFPKRLALKRPTTAEISERFHDVKCWIDELRRMQHCRVEMREVHHRVVGSNVVPHEVWIDSCDDAVAILGMEREANRFTALVRVTAERCPLLLPWLAQRPLRALELHQQWDQLLSVVDWIREHPRPGVYLREVDLPGIHTKFLEVHRSVLSECFDLILPRNAIDERASGTSQFEKRYGFLHKPERVRFRVLDPDCDVIGQGCTPDVTLDTESFATLQLNVLRVFITENEINFLTFPRTKRSAVIFGAGYGFEMLANAKWLSDCKIYYWGDIDTHGFAILNELRGYHAGAQSFLMDRTTLMAFQSQWGEEDNQTLQDLSRLTDTERMLYDDLRDNRIRAQLRLEQERIGFKWVAATLANLA